MEVRFDKFDSSQAVNEPRIQQHDEGYRATRMMTAASLGSRVTGVTAR